MTRLKPWLQRIDGLTARERGIVLVLTLAALWALADAALFSPQTKTRQALETRINSHRTALAESSQVVAQAAGQMDPDAAARTRLEQARQKLETRFAEASRLQGRLVAPKDMTRALQGLLARQPGLRLVSLKTLPPKPLGLAEGGKEEDAALYRHGLILTVAGDYAALLRYLEGLERLPQGYYWERAELDAKAHPEVRLTLTLNTLALERTWLAF
jgi:MSHA biogenesis protein MshJ